MADIHPTASGFADAAGPYERARPGYPPATVARLIDRLEVRPGRRVVDVAAGTGLLTAHLVAAGAEVTALEPVAEMREALRRRVPEATVVAGRAEALPLPTASAHAATVAQAFHWFDAPTALAELHRVLRPEAPLAVLFNVRDLEDEAQAALADLLRDIQGNTPSWASRDWDTALRSASTFTVTEHHEETHVHELDADGFADRVASISFVARLEPTRRAQVLADAQRLFERLATGGRLGMRYRTELTLLRRTGGPAGGPT